MTCRSVRNRRRITIYGKEITERDWRGILALLTTIGYFVTVSITTLRYDFAESLTTAALLSTPEMLVLSWYFRAKEEEE